MRLRNKTRSDYGCNGIARHGGANWVPDTSPSRSDDEEEATELRKTLIKSVRTNLKHTCNIVTININGIREKRKKIALGRALCAVQAAVCVVTEAHIREEDLETIKIPNYKVITHCCREVETRLGGGVVISVHKNYKAKLISENNFVGGGVETCSIDFFPTKEVETALHVIGIYIPPKVAEKLTIGALKELTAPRCVQPGLPWVSKIFAGDLNPTSWEVTYREWINTHGIWELVDPTVPTYETGSALDKMLFLPGGYIPSTFLTEGKGGGMEALQHNEDRPYPAWVHTGYSIGDHFPLILPVPCESGETVCKERKLAL